MGLIVANSTEFLERMGTGGDSALVSAYRRYEPILRAMVRRHLSRALRVKFDSQDIVQSLWSKLIPGFREGRWRFPTAQHFQAFLVRAARNKLVDRTRQVREAVRREHRDNDMVLDLRVGNTPAPGADFEAADLWERLCRDCPEQHRVVVDLKRCGYTLDEIAARTSMHKSSVRKILYKLINAARQEIDGKGDQ
jgi:RNA polymerase sigma factor (sigma-70 family)